MPRNTKPQPQHSLPFDEELELLVTGFSLQKLGQAGKENLNIRLEEPGCEDEKDKRVYIQVHTLVPKFNGVFDSVVNCFPTFGNEVRDMSPQQLRLHVGMKLRGFKPGTDPWGVCGSLVSCRIMPSKTNPVYTDNSGKKWLNHITYLNGIVTDHLTDEEFEQFLMNTSLTA